MRRCAWLVPVLLFGGFILSGCPGESTTSPPPIPPKQSMIADQVAKARAKGAAALVALQRPDGHWPYFKHPESADGTKNVPSSATVTAFAFFVLSGMPADIQTTHADSIRWAEKAILGSQESDGAIGDGQQVIRLRAYATALSLGAMARMGRDVTKGPAGRMRSWLLNNQLQESSGTPSYDGNYGSWPYHPGRSLGIVRTDISLHAYVLEGLKLAKVPVDNKVWVRAAKYLERCQNYGQNGDGGFVFNPSFSKAGVAGKDTSTPTGLLSYGTTTADGLRSLFLCGIPPSSVPIQGALKWHGSHWSLSGVPGFGPDAPPGWKTGMRFYYLSALARALELTGNKTIKTEGSTLDWPQAIAKAVIDEQRGNGSWKNTGDWMHEDVPSIATGLALLALESSSRMLD